MRWEIPFGVSLSGSSRLNVSRKGVMVADYDFETGDMQFVNDDGKTFIEIDDAAIVPGDWTVRLVTSEGSLLVEESGHKKGKAREREFKTARPWDLLNPNTKYVSADKYKERMDICRACPMLALSTCKECHCYMPLKTRLAHAECPIQKWGME